jgi:ATPase family associated with various cellular activities (AAA)
LSVSAYFNRATAEPYEVDDQQLKTLNAFKENTFKHFSALTIDFNGAKDFEDKFRAHLTNKLINLSPNIPRGLPYIPEHLLNASTGILSWPTTLRSGQYIERNELQTILQRIDESESSTTIILGSPGTGKSALLATLANRLREKGTPLLAIKADQLGPEVNSPEDLRDFLGLPIIARDAIKVQSEKEKIVLIIDQLDAVSELLDRKSGRLNVLLNLVHSLASQPNTHIVASSREFEFRHDIRLASIDAERLDLAPPNWDQVAAVISQFGIKPTTMGESLKELLLVPLNLKVFLDIATPNLTFESFHALLEELWRRRVVEGQNGDERERERLLELLAERMGNEETLWLPSAVCDSYPVARKELEQADILARGSNGLTIGFRHQTFYDFTLARMLRIPGISASRKNGLERNGSRGRNGSVRIVWICFVPFP